MIDYCCCPAEGPHYMGFNPFPPSFTLYFYIIGTLKLCLLLVSATNTCFYQLELLRNKGMDPNYFIRLGLLLCWFLSVIN